MLSDYFQEEPPLAPIIPMSQIIKVEGELVQLFGANPLWRKFLRLFCQINQVLKKNPLRNENSTVLMTGCLYSDSVFQEMSFDPIYSNSYARN